MYVSVLKASKAKDANPNVHSGLLDWNAGRIARVMEEYAINALESARAVQLDEVDAIASRAVRKALGVLVV